MDATLCFFACQSSKHFLVVQTSEEEGEHRPHTQQNARNLPGTVSLNSLFTETTLSSNPFLTWRILHKILESKTTSANRSSVFLSGTNPKEKEPSNIQKRWQTEGSAA